MGRRATWLVIAAVACLAAVAIADVRDSDAGEPQAATPTTAAAGQDTLRAPVGAGLRGVLYYTDENCELRAIRFPDLRPVTIADPWTDCRFTMSPRGAGDAAMEGSRWAPDEVTAASESEGSVAVASTGTNGFSFAGFAPAFRPDGRLGFAAPDGVRALDIDCARVYDAATEQEAMLARCSELVLSRSDLRRAVYLDANAPDEPGSLRRLDLRGLAWFDSRHPVVLLRATFRLDPRVEVVAFFEDRRPWAISRAFGLAPELELSPFRNYVTAHAQAGDGIVVLDRDARAVPLPTLPQAHRVAWSPDERWLAVATQASVYIVRVGDPNARARRLGLVASDLAWRAG
jgi:hypothetical protein